MIVIKPNIRGGELLLVRLGVVARVPVGDESIIVIANCRKCRAMVAHQVHAVLGVAKCVDCGRWITPLDLAELIVGDRDQARDILSQIGLHSDDLDVCR